VSTYAVVVRASVARAIRKLPREIALRIRRAIGDLQENPRPPGALPVATRTDILRTRVGDYRILYAVHDERLLVLVVRVAHRTHAYERLPDPGSGGRDDVD
jgi:mRNA interferase RelE/StbE